MKTRVLFLLLSFFFYGFVFGQKGVIIKTNSEQNDFLNAYKAVLYLSDKDYRFTSTVLDTKLFPLFGEHSLYWITEGANKSGIVFTDTIPQMYKSITANEYTDYNLSGTNHLSIQFKNTRKTIAIFQSKIKAFNYTISWQANYFKNLFDAYFFNSMYYIADEDLLTSSSISDSTKLIIISAFTEDGSNQKRYIDSIFMIKPEIKNQLLAFLAKGGTIYAEGNAVYFIEKLGLIAENAVDFSKNSNSNSTNGNLFSVSVNNNSEPIGFASLPNNNQLYGLSVPLVNVQSNTVIASLSNDNRPLVFVLKGNQANGGRIICNLGLPTAGGYLKLTDGSRQLQWTFNAILSAFTKKIDVTRSVFNQIPNGISVGKNGVSYEALDTFEVRVLLRNLTNQTLNGIEAKESFREYFTFYEVVTPNVSYTVDKQDIIFNNITLYPFEEKTIVYRLITPKPEDKIHENVDKYLSFSRYMYASQNTTTYYDETGKNVFKKYRNYVDVMFGARIFADADVNWKNFLYLDYQPFKVFMNMENKERTSGEQTEYVQYIPKDVPFYWTDGALNIPILKTPGGKFVTVLKGTSNIKNIEYDMDSDGKPDVWLDTASIYPKGYTITEEEVYWQNPWAHLNGAKETVYEDINHDGITAKDLNGDGIVDVEAPGDKIRVWKVTWNIGRVAGYQSFDPYCYYELWIDPPDLVNLSKGVGYAKGFISNYENGMFYPYTPDIKNADLSNSEWSHWMDKDANGNVIYKNMILQKMNNYEGFTFVDDNYQLKPYDVMVGKVPQPHREFIAVVSLGGEEIDMTHPTPSASAYSKIKYKTIFNEDKITPIRTTYTYYAPLPNPLQFEYLSNNYVITDINTKDTLQYLPEWGKANLTFEMDAATEYSYYWIRNVGYKVDYNDPSLKFDGVKDLGDGVFGYLIYEIPKGYAGYNISLPKKSDGTYDINNIVKIDGKNFEKWIDNPNTKNEIEIWEDAFKYQIYIPQILIPPALCDKNKDGIDDWIDDRGDRFKSNTGFLHDAFMTDNGENYLTGSANVFAHNDFGYGLVTDGWSAGNDNTYGDDRFDKLGKTHIRINAIYEGKGKEGPIEISKGGTLVVEEIFGGSPWFIGSHVLSGYAKGVEIKCVSTSNPSIIKFGKDTTFIKHEIYDKNEPHQFNSQFDPYLVSNGYGKATVTTYVGGKDPCNLISPAIDMPGFIDPVKDKKTITLIPLADKQNPDLKDYPKTITGTFVEIKIEVTNGGEENWYQTTIIPKLSKSLKNSSVVMSYVAYPRPLVPSQYDPISGIITSGDEIGSFKAGWRFNQPEDEVLVKIGNTLNLLQAPRRAYFVFLIQLDETLPKGVYTIDFDITGKQESYDGKVKKTINYKVPSAMIGIGVKNSIGLVVEYPNFIIGQTNLQSINTFGTNNFIGLQNSKFSFENINHTDFNNLTKTVPASFSNGVETINLTQFKNFPSLDTTKIFILEQVQYESKQSTDTVLADKIRINYDFIDRIYQKDGPRVTVLPSGPMIDIRKKVVAINDIPYTENMTLPADVDIYVDVEVEFYNYGNDIAQNVIASIYPGTSYIVQTVEPAMQVTNNIVSGNLGTFIPGQTKIVKIRYKFVETDKFDISTVLLSADFKFSGTISKKSFISYNKEPLEINVYDFKVTKINYEQIDAKKIRVKAKAINRGKNASNVKFQLYPVFSGANGMVFGETIILNFKKGEEIELVAEYTSPISGGNIELIAKADVDNSFNEIIEKNNLKSFLITFVGIDNELISKMKFTTYPNPVIDNLNFSYYLTDSFKNIEIKLFSIDGKEINTNSKCSNKTGNNDYQINCNHLKSGTYIYQMYLYSVNQVKIISGKIVKR